MACKNLTFCFWAMLVLIVLLQAFALPSRSRPKLEYSKSEAPVKFIPDMRSTAPGNAEHLIYKTSFYYSNPSLEHTHFQILPSDCVSRIVVNGKAVPFAQPNSCNPSPASYWGYYTAPIYIDFGPYISPGRTIVEVHTSRPQFEIGPVIFATFDLAACIGILMALVTCMALVIILKRGTGDVWSGYILSVAFLLFLRRFSMNGVSQYSMDLPGHLDYIAYIASTWEWPSPDWGWSTYHPPLYYTLAAIVLRIANALRSVDVITCIQLFSLLSFMAFLSYAALALHRLIPSKTAYYTALLLLAFYPSGILFAARLDSHLLFYAFYAACFYYTLCWLEEGRQRELIRAIIALGLALGTRSNAFILLALFGLAWLHYSCKHGGWREMIDGPVIRAAFLVVFAGLIMSIGRTAFYHYTENRNVPYLVGNINKLSKRLILHDSSLLNVLLPNFTAYFKYPLWDVWSDAGNRLFFWNSMLKSSLFGEYVWAKIRLAGWMGNLLLALIAYTCEAWWKHRRALRLTPAWRLCLISLLVPIAALMTHRLLYPYASSEDFRYIYPALTSFCTLYGLAIQSHINDWRPFRAALGVILAVLFVGCSVVFYF